MPTSTLAFISCDQTLYYYLMLGSCFFTVCPRQRSLVRGQWLCSGEKAPRAPLRVVDDHRSGRSDRKDPVCPHVDYRHRNLPREGPPTLTERRNMTVGSLSRESLVCISWNGRPRLILDMGGCLFAWGAIKAYLVYCEVASDGSFSSESMLL